MSANHTMAEIIRAHTRRGWIVEPTNNNHLRWRLPGHKALVFSAKTPSGGNRSIPNLLARLAKIEREAAAMKDAR